MIQKADTDMPTPFSTSPNAESAFYDAFERANLSAMMEVWVRSGPIVCVHPSGGRLEGFEAVRAGWARLFASGPRLRFQLDSRRIVNSDALAVHFVREGISTDGEFRGWVLSTNVYELGDNGWRMLAHHASVEPRARSRPAEETMLH